MVALVDVYGGQVDSRKAGHPVATRTCSLFIADYQHFSSRPGLKVLQVGAECRLQAQLSMQLMACCSRMSCGSQQIRHYADW